MSIHTNDFVEAKKHLKLSPSEILSTIGHLQKISQSELAKLTKLTH